MSRKVKERGSTPPHEAAPRDDTPSTLLTIDEVARSLGLTIDGVVKRELDGELFSIFNEHRHKGRGYPAFQVWSDFAAAPQSSAASRLAEVLHELGAPSTSGSELYGFFVARNDLLGYATPVEVVVGRLTSHREVDPEVIDLLHSPLERRMQAVLSAARAYAADIAA